MALEQDLALCIICTGRFCREEEVKLDSADTFAVDVDVHICA